jgi:hypothetical protein
MPAPKDPRRPRAGGLFYAQSVAYVRSIAAHGLDQVGAEDAQTRFIDPFASLPDASLPIEKN